MRQKLAKNERAILAALALAAHYFPSGTRTGPDLILRACFLPAGRPLRHMGSLARASPSGKKRIAAVLAAAPEELSRPAMFRERAVKLLDRRDDEQRPVQFRLAGASHDPRDGKPDFARALADRMLADLSDLHC